MRNGAGKSFRNAAEKVRRQQTTEGKMVAKLRRDILSKINQKHKEELGIINIKTNQEDEIISKIRKEIEATIQSIQEKQKQLESKLIIDTSEVFTERVPQLPNYESKRNDKLSRKQGNTKQDHNVKVRPPGQQNEAYTSDKHAGTKSLICSCKKNSNVPNSDKSKCWICLKKKAILLTPRKLNRLNKTKSASADDTQVDNPQVQGTHNSVLLGRGSSGGRRRMSIEELTQTDSVSRLPQRQLTESGNDIHSLRRTDSSRTYPLPDSALGNSYEEFNERMREEARQEEN